METGCFIAVGVRTAPPTYFSGHLLVYVSVTDRIYQACAYLHVQTCMQACMDPHAFVSLTLAFVVQLLGDWNIEVSSSVPHEIKKDVNCPQMVNCQVYEKCCDKLNVHSQSWSSVVLKVLYHGLNLQKY